MDKFPFAALLALMLVAAAGVARAASHPPQPQTFAAIQAAPPQESLSFQLSWRPDLPEYGVPEGATAKCRDGHYSFAREHRAACSRHGGVESWLQAL